MTDLAGQTELLRKRTLYPHSGEWCRASLHWYPKREVFLLAAAGLRFILPPVALA